MKDARLLAVGHRCASAGRCVERRDAGAGSPHPLGKRALGYQLDLKFSGEVLRLKDGVLPDI